MQKQSILKRDQSLIKPFNKNKLLTIFQRGNPQDVQMFNNVNEKGVVNNTKKNLAGFWYGSFPFPVAFPFYELLLTFGLDAKWKSKAFSKGINPLLNPLIGGGSLSDH